MGDLRVVIDDAKLNDAINNANGTREALKLATDHIISKANSLGSGYRTAKYKHSTVGGKQPEYGGDVKKGKSGLIGIVHPTNYAAMKDNHLHNTMLKSVGGGYV